MYMFHMELQLCHINLTKPSQPHVCPVVPLVKCFQRQKGLLSAQRCKDHQASSVNTQANENHTALLHNCLWQSSKQACMHYEACTVPHVPPACAPWGRSRVGVQVIVVDLWCQIEPA